MLLVAAAYAEGPYQATGFKVGEVTDSTAIVWTRLTLKAKPNPPTAPTLTFSYSGGATFQPDLRERPKHPPTRLNGIEYTTKGGANDIRYAAPGVAGEVRVLYSTEIREARQTIKNTLWQIKF